MGSKYEHKKNYERNKALASSNLISKDENRDWNITIKYYSILHLVDSTYADESIHPGDHRERKKAIRNKYGKSFLSTYVALEGYSRQARYDCIPITKESLEIVDNISLMIEKKIV